MIKSKCHLKKNNHSTADHSTRKLMKRSKHNNVISNSAHRILLFQNFMSEIIFECMSLNFINNISSPTSVPTMSFYPTLSPFFQFKHLSFTINITLTDNFEFRKLRFELNYRHCTVLLDFYYSNFKNCFNNIQKTLFIADKHYSS